MDPNDQDDDEFAFDEFDQLLAQLPLSDLQVPPSDSTIPSTLHKSCTQPFKRKISTAHISSPKIDPQTPGCYEAIQFGQIGQYMANKRLKLQLQQSTLRDTDALLDTKHQFLTGLVIHVSQNRAALRFLFIHASIIV